MVNLFHMEQFILIPDIFCASLTHRKHVLYFDEEILSGKSLRLIMESCSSFEKITSRYILYMYMYIKMWLCSKELQINTYLSYIQHNNGNIERDK